MVSERPIDRAEVIVDARVIRTICTLDDGLADDKIVSVLTGDAAWGSAEDMDDLPAVTIQRLRHYFATCKLVPGQKNPVELLGQCGRADALELVRAAMADYDERYGCTDQEQG